MEYEYEKSLEELIALQRKKLMQCAEQFIPYITEEDLMQPNDFPVLENHPYFRHEEGILEGLLTALSAFRAVRKG